MDIHLREYQINYLLETKYNLTNKVISRKIMFDANVGLK